MRVRHVVLIGSAVLLVTPAASSGQEVFHSTQSANLPTAEVLRAGNWMFEISHRFTTPMSEGGGELFGFDGPARIRLGLTFAPSDRVVLGVLRTNDEDNLEFQAKAALLEGGSESTRFKLGAMGGAAWNTEPILIEGAEDNELQLYAQLIANVLLGERLAVGVVPTYLRNPRLRDVDAANGLALGLHAQWYAGDAVSLLAEWLVTEARAGQEYDAGTFGVEFETRGHFFKVVVTNQPRLNPTQVLGGSSRRFELDQLGLGFNITRLLPF